MSSILSYQNNLSPQAFAHVLTLCENSKINFILASSRTRKLGDFKSMGQKAISISINHDLDPNFFLFVWLHEWAHYLTFQKHQRKVAPHGYEWKRCYQELLHQAIHLFSVDFQAAVMRFSANPKANLSAATEMYMLFKKEQDKGTEIKITMLNIGDEFAFQGQLFKIAKYNSKTFTCHAMPSMEIYSVSTQAYVRPIVVANSSVKSLENLQDTEVKLSNLLSQECFIFDKQAYKAIKKQRSNYICQNLNNKKEYLIKCSVFVKLMPD
jgi:SprT protein